MVNEQTHCYGCGNSQNTIQVSQISVISISVCSDQISPPMSKRNCSCNRAVIFESAVILLLSLFWNNHLLHHANHNHLLHNANHNHISTTKTTPLLTTFATTNDIPPSSPQTPPFYYGQQRPHRATSLPNRRGGSLIAQESVIPAMSAQGW